ncbi:uncharacterized protein LOC117823314 [Xyrichtys novacula]|uniref:Uncharacterized protein LOC117823314 n=1 Tax=Xyrichtys novacula TaxID=13765 RepID=A0AAV1FMQ8_XYRNO|nr:uncharacterized protein LOC117823314 [Xyrichtys novacula]
MELLKNCSLVIDCLTEKDQGTYLRQICFQGRCQEEQLTVSGIKEENHKEAQKTVYVLAGGNFTHSCPDERLHFKWTFEASNMTADRDGARQQQSYSVTSKSINISNVTTKNAGKYTCLTSRCHGFWEKQLTINLCVITVHRKEDSLVSCAVECDRESSVIEPNGTSIITPVLGAPKGYLNCTPMQVFVGYEEVNIANRSANVPKTTMDTTPALIHAVYGTSIALGCLILMALLIYFIGPGVFPIQLHCCGLHHRMEEEISVIYSSLLIRGSVDATNSPRANDDGCVYSEIRI